MRSKALNKITVHFVEKIQEKNKEKNQKNQLKSQEKIKNQKNLVHFFSSALPLGVREHAL